MNGTTSRRDSEDVDNPSIDEQSIEELYRWLDAVPFSRQRRNGARDFADAGMCARVRVNATSSVLVAELIAHFLPRYIDLHMYMPASSAQLKRYNWDTLNKCVHCLCKLMCSLLNSQNGVNSSRLPPEQRTD
jgi:hypothetical protein